MTYNQGLGATVSFEEIFSKIGGINSHYSMTPDELRFAVELANTLPQGPSMMELGVCHGRTFAALTIIAMEKYGVTVGVDDWKLEGSPSEVSDTMDALGLTGWQLHRTRTQDLIWVDTPLDFLLIDAGHDEANVKPDIEKYVPLIKHRGIVLFHDYDEPFDRASAHWAVRYYADRACGDWNDLGQVGGLKAWKRP